jgi:hypothetical protein
MGAGRGLGCVRRWHAGGRSGGRSLRVLSDHVAERHSAAGVPLVAKFVPEFPARTTDESRHKEHPDHPWLMLLRQRVFALVTLVGALIIGSHAMYDSFAVIRWREAGIRPATIALLWSESVAAEVVVFLLIGPPLLRVLKPTGALAWAALCGLLRWGVMAQTTELAALALVQPLHGFTFALLHLASMRLSSTTFNVTCTRENVWAVRMPLNGCELFADIGPLGAREFFSTVGPNLGVATSLFCYICKNSPFF